MSRVQSYTAGLVRLIDVRVGSKLGQIAPNGTNLELIKIGFVEQVSLLDLDLDLNWANS